MTICLACARPVGDGHMLACPQIFAAYPSGYGPMADFHMTIFDVYQAEQRSRQAIEEERAHVRRMEEELGATSGST